ncbi:MAG: hypothetical protein KJZ87_13290 [Thermoguttaceae bacterium]|nr:hypothetical protein [Thermoguttaceae bacterium]
MKPLPTLLLLTVALIHQDGYILTADHVVRDRPGWVLLENRPRCATR